MDAKALKDAISEFPLFHHPAGIVKAPEPTELE